MVVSVIGEVDALTAPILRGRLDDLIEGQGNRSIVLDVGAMTFIDSIGLSVILDSHSRLRARGGKLVVAHVPRSVVRLLEMTRLSTVLTFSAA